MRAIKLAASVFIASALLANARQGGPTESPVTAKTLLVKAVVVDRQGAVITYAEVLFKGESGTVVAHTGADGSVNVNLAAGKYFVTVSAFGFATAKLVDFSVPSATAGAFRVILEIDPSAFHQYGSGSDPSEHIAVPTEPSELPNIINDEPTRTTSLPVVQRAITKRRSMRCLYLWRCSASQP